MSKPEVVIRFVRETKFHYLLYQRGYSTQVAQIAFALGQLLPKGHTLDARSEEMPQPSIEPDIVHEIHFAKISLSMSDKMRSLGLSERTAGWACYFAKYLYRLDILDQNPNVWFLKKNI